MLDALAEPAEDGRPRAVVVGADAPARTELRRRRFSSPVEIERLAGVDVFPGMRPQQPTVIMARPVADDLELRDGSTEVWVRGDREQAVQAFGDADIAFREDRTVDDVVDRVSFLTVSWTFGVLQALGVVAGVLALGGMALYLDARRRGRVLGYAFARRMGLGRAAHRRVLLAELLRAWSWAAGSGSRPRWSGRGWPTAGRPGARPGAGPSAAAGGAVDGRRWHWSALAVAGVAAALAQRRTDRDDPVDVLRAGL